MGRCQASSIGDTSARRLDLKSAHSVFFSEQAASHAFLAALKGIDVRQASVSRERFRSDISGQAKRIVVMEQIVDIAVQVDDFANFRIADSRTIALADRPSADRNEECRFSHGEIAADRPFRSADVHVLRMTVGQNARGGRRKNHGGAGQLSERSDLLGEAAPAAADFDDNAVVSSDLGGGGPKDVFVRHRRRSDAMGRRKRGQIDPHHARLRVDRREKIERPGLKGMTNRAETLPQRFAQRLRRMQYVAAPHDLRESAIGALARLRDLLHVVAFAMRRRVAINVVDADAVRRRRE